MSPGRHYSPLDRLIIEAQRALTTSIGPAVAERSNPGQLSDAKPVNPTCMNPRRDMGPAQRTRDGGWMRDAMCETYGRWHHHLACGGLAGLICRPERKVE